MSLMLFYMTSTSAEIEEEIDAIRPLISVRLPNSPELLVKGFDLKSLTRLFHPSVGFQVQTICNFPVWH